MRRPPPDPENGLDLYVGLSGLQLAEDAFSIGEGIMLRKTSAHVMLPVLVTFPHAEGVKSHPGNIQFDITAELLIPAALENRYKSRSAIATTLLFLIRLGVNPAATSPVFSSHSFSTLADVPDNQSRMLIHEIQERRFALTSPHGQVSAKNAWWLETCWPVTHRLLKDSAEFALAAEALDSGQFVQNSALLLVSMWGALESMFSPSTSELRFRVSALIATYLEPAGVARAKLQKEIAKLYDKRSAAAHGKPTHELDHVFKTFGILQRVLTMIIARGKVPSKDELEGLLFGMS